MMSRRKSTLVSKPGTEDAIMISSSDENSARSSRLRAKVPVSDQISSPKRQLRKSLARKSQVSAFVEESSNTEDPEEPTDRRRSMRRRSPSKRYTTDFVQVTPKKVSSRRKAHDDDHSASEHDTVTLDSEEESQFDELATKVKATTLFEDRVDVEGHRIYGFKTPKKRGSMSVLVSSVHKTPSVGSPKTGAIRKVIATPRTPKTPASAKRKSRANLAKTPHRDRTKLKKNISKIVRDESGSDFSASDSDFVPSSEEENDDSDGEGASDEENSSSSSEKDTKPKRPINKSQFAAINISPGKASTSAEATQNIASRTRTRGRKKAELEYVLQSDEYFSTHSSSKVVTSDHTLDRLNTPRLPHDQLFRLLRELRGSSEHQKAIHELHEEYEGHFSKWLFLMNEGFNILLYGLGSKRNLLQTFHRKVLPNRPVIVINGFFPTLTVKDILDAISNDILDLNVHSANFHEVVDIIEEEFSYLPDTHLFLIVHNLDGTMLRNSKSQNVLARLAKIDNIHLLASIDHINTPLIWDSSKLSYYNFSWWDVTTMLPYSDETAFENSLLVQNSGALALSSMKNVFQSLTTNSRGIFLIIVKHQLANKGNPHYPGMLFKELYSNCREAFLVSTDLALRAQLTEFIDHKLVKVKRTVDGAENLLIPIEHGLLQQFVEENEGK